METYLKGVSGVTTENRLRILRLIENLTLGTAAVGYRTESLHGAGSPQAQRIMIARQGNLQHKKELAKTIQKKGEEAKVAIRSIRRDAIEQIKKAQKDSEITEDDRKKLEDQAQKLTDSHIKDIDKIVSDKQKEIMEV